MVYKPNLDKSIEKLKGRDRVGVAGEVASTLTGVAGGTLAAGSLAAAAGATTIPVLTSTLGWFGITIVSATPVGWIAGTAIAGGCLAFALGRTILSGGRQDQVRKDLIERLKNRSVRLSTAKANMIDTRRLLSAIDAALEVGIDPSIAERTIKLVSEGKLDSELAISRLNAARQALSRDKCSIA